MTRTAIVSATLLVLMATSAWGAQPVRIGLAAPLNGPQAVFGTALRRGVEQAVADIDDAGGLLGRQAQVVARDDGGDAGKGVDIAKGFVRDGIGIVVGDFSSAVTIPASAVYGEAGVLDITPSATAPAVTERGFPTIFRMCGREDGQAAAAARFLTGRHYARVAVLHDRTANSKAVADGLRAVLAGAGIDVFYGSFAETARDVSPLVGRLRGAGMQIVVWTGNPPGAALLARQLRDGGARLPLLGTLATAADEFPSLAGPAADGTYVLFPQDPRRRAAAADLLRRLKAEGIDPGGYLFYAYAAVQVVQQAATRAGSLEPKALAAAMHAGTPFDTVIGRIAFDAKGDPTPSDLTVYVWHKGPAGRMDFSEPAGT